MSLEENLLKEEITPAAKETAVVKPKKRLWCPFGRLKSGRGKKKLLIVFGVFVLLAIFLMVFGVLPALSTLNQAKEVVQEAKEVSTAFQNQDLDEAGRKIASAREKLGATQGQFQRLKWSRLIPFVGGYYQDGEHVFQAGFYGLEAAELVIEAIKPYADVIGFKGGEGFSAKTAEERVIFVVQTLEKIAPQLDEISGQLNQAKDEIMAINAGRYPKKVRDQEVRAKIISLQETVRESTESLTQIKPALTILPQLLGEPDEKQYLLLFQNDKELRPTGGFMTAYAILKVHHGKITPVKSEDIYALDARFNQRLPAPDPIKKYLPLVYYWNLRDMNLSPDFKLSMDNFGKYYQEIGGAQIDGIIGIDTQLPVDLLEILGPVGVADWGIFSAEIDPTCNCPQVIHELEKLADKPVGEVKTGRKAVLGPLMHSILLNVMGSPRKLWPEFFNVGIDAIKEKHVLLYFFDEDSQKAAEAFQAAGRIKDYEGDYLHINDCNFAGAKSNMFIRVNVQQLLEVAGDGTVTKTVTIDYKNPEPASDCNLERGELCLNGPYRNWFRLYVPQGSELIEQTGSEVPMETYEELGKTVFEGFFGDKHPLRPEGSAKVVVKYKLPFKVQKGEKYKLFIQKQPGTYGYEYLISADGQEIERFELLTDKELRLTL